MPVFKNKNINFFKKWSPAMAYTLGFFCADGSMFVNPRGSYYVAFYSSDKTVIDFIRASLDSNHKISVKPAGKDGRSVPGYVLQIGSKEIFCDLRNLGLVPNKYARLRLPKVPTEFLAPFVRGYFDGDGSVGLGYYKKVGRKTASLIMSVRFTSSSKRFLESLRNSLHRTVAVYGAVFFQGNAWRLSYSTRSARRLLDFIYAAKQSFFPVIDRKYRKFLESKFLYGPVA